MSECLICFCPIEGRHYGCGDPLCTVSTCAECTGYLLTYSEGEGIIPQCPGEKCNSPFIISQLSGLPQEIIQKYYLACFKFILKSNGDAVLKKMASNKVLKKLREERMQFIQENFPAAIAVVASVAFNTKLKRLEKARKNRIKSNIAGAHRHCLNATCKGFLDKDLVCLVCISTFCAKCEKIKRDGHKCKDGDVASVSMVNDMVRCPGCNLPVFKDRGCNSITCSNCGTNFKYSTGQKGGHGSSNARIQFQENKILALSTSYKEIVNEEQLDILLRIELQQPPTYTKEILMPPIQKYYKEIPEGEEEASPEVILKCGKTLANRYDKYMQNRYHNRDYQNYLIEVEEMLQENKVVNKKLLKILKAIEKLNSSRKNNDKKSSSKKTSRKVRRI